MDKSVKIEAIMQNIYTNALNVSKSDCLFDIVFDIKKSVIAVIIFLPLVSE